MPPTFVYALALAIWAPAAVIVWIAAAVLMVAPRTRSTGRSLALAMAATFPGVILYQVVAIPFIVLILVSMWAVSFVLNPSGSDTTTSPLLAGLMVTGAMMAFGTMLGMSVLGFAEAWRIGWLCGKGRRFDDVVATGPSARLMRSGRLRVRSHRNRAEDTGLTKEGQ